MDFQLPEGTSPEVAALFAKDDIKALVAGIVEQAKTPLVAKRDELLGQLSTYKQTLSKVDELGGIDALTAAQQARAEAEASRKAAELAAAEKDGNAEALKKHYGEQLSAREAELQALRQSIIDERVSSKLGKEIREAKGVPELLEPHLKGRIKSEMVDGKVKVTVLTATGVPMLKDDGKEASVADLLAEFRASPIFHRAFEAPTASGSGSRPSGAPTTENPWSPNSKNITKQMQVYRQDPALAKRMAAEHGVQLP